MALTTSITVGRLLQRNELVDTAKINAMVRGIVINITGSVGSSDIAAGAVNAAATSADAFWYAPATSSAGLYTAVYANAVSNYVDGMWLSFKADAACPAAPQFDAGAGAKPLLNSTGVVLGSAEIAANNIVTVRYNSTLLAGGCWEVMSRSAIAPIDFPFRGAGSRGPGEIGLVPKPLAGQQGLYLRGDGTWQDAVGDAVDQIATNAVTESLFAAAHFS